MDLKTLQDALRQEELDGWLFCDFHHRDHVARTVLGLTRSEWMTRRWFYFVPSQGSPRKLLHHIESGQLASLPGEVRTYLGWADLRTQLRDMLAGFQRVAMQYSPLNELPSIAMADAGTVELVRSFGHEVVSSANLVHRCDSPWPAEALKSHLEAGRAIDGILRETFHHIGQRIAEGRAANEYDVQRFMAERLERHGLITDSPPIVAAGSHSGIPHYAPQPEGSLTIRAGELVLLDIWAKCNRPGAVYYDITWTGYTGSQPPERMEEIFHVVRTARDTAVNVVDEAMRAGTIIHGFEVDRAARAVIEAAGYGEYFVHRTGHSIGQSVHANGANMDDLETHDTRPLIPETCFSIEPGIYLPEFGIRSEVDVYVESRAAAVTGAVQNEIVRIRVEP